MITYGLNLISFYFLYKLMKKKTINAFTLVEMLIVIVIIGILIAALLPRMQAAQWRARDVSRKTALSQIQSAIVVSQWDKWRWPGCNTDWCTSGNNWMDVSDITTEIKAAWMNSVPQDPTAWSKCSWLWTLGDDSKGWEYRYLVAKRNWTDNWWFALMAKTEVEWWSNRVTCSGASGTGKWWLTHSNDISDITLCTTVEKTWEGWCAGVEECRSNTWVCCYSTTDELRYLVLY